MTILGLNAYHGDSAACLIRDGELVAAAEEERFRRIKHWAGLPTQSIDYCLAEGGLSLGDVEHIAINRKPGVNNWRRLGFTDDDVRKPGSDKLIDAVVAHGTPEQVAARLNEHLESGADHVAIQVLGGPDGKLLGALEALAGPLGLTPPR